MKVLEYLNNLCQQGASSFTALGILEENFGVTYTSNPDYPELVVLNYSQIDSPKFDTITNECRSLVLEIYGAYYEPANENIELFKVVSRSFDRFYNYSEEPNTEYDITTMTAYEKVDGSLIGLFYTEKYGWLYRTRKQISPKTKINGWDLTWDKLIEGALDLDNFNTWYTNDLTDCTYVLEVVSPENRVVTRYTNRDVYLLAIRDNNSGNYLDNSVVTDVINKTNWKLPASYMFKSFTDCTIAAKALRDLQEGYVLYDQQGVPKVKVKNPAYVAAHHLRGEGLNTKRMMQLIFMNETAEYLSIFPEDADKFLPYITKYNLLLDSLISSCSLYGHITDQKEFALSVKDLPYSSVLFQAKAKKLDPVQVWHDMKESYKLKVMENL